MKKRGPKAKTGESDRSAVFSARISQSTRARLVAAGARPGTNMAKEIENRLSRSFLDDETIKNAFGDRQTYAVALLAFAAARSTVGRKSWLYDPQAFDAAVVAINAVLKLIRPGEGLEASDGATYQAEFSALETVRDVQIASKVQPVEASRHMRRTIALRRDMGDIVDRAVIRGVDADQARKRSKAAKEFGVLRRKQAMTPDAMTNEELNRLDALAGEIERMLR
jgi:hypothetical protein